MEQALAYGIRQRRGRTFADLWDFDRLATCPACRERRKERLREMNRLQTVLPVIDSAVCCGG